ncbi:alcohol dehydrogenase catalytic domain-containing protein [Mycobacterium colombiense]
MNAMIAARALPNHEVAVQKTAVPAAKSFDVVVKVMSAGLAPGMTSLLKMGAFKHLPTTLGHEAAGTIAAVGDNVQDVKVGDRVRVHPNLNCRSCAYCRSDRDMMCAQQAMLGHAAFGTVPLPLYAEYHDGGLAEYVRVPYWLVDPLPDSVTFDVGAKVHDLANALRALKCTQVSSGSTLIITAATGTMGTATIKLAHTFGVSQLILVGRSAERLHKVAGLARELETAVVALEELSPDWDKTAALTQAIRRVVPRGADAVIDYIPTGAATAQSMGALATGGTMVHMGANPAPLAFPTIALMANCWKFVGTRSCTRNDALQVLRMLGSGAVNIDELITHRFPLVDSVAAIDAMACRREPMWMSVVHP